MSYKAENNANNRSNARENRSTKSFAERQTGVKHVATPAKKQTKQAAGGYRDGYNPSKGK